MMDPLSSDILVTFYSHLTHIVHYLPFHSYGRCLSRSPHTSVVRVFMTHLLHFFVSSATLQLYVTIVFHAQYTLVRESRIYCLILYLYLTCSHVLCTRHFSLHLLGRVHSTHENVLERDNHIWLFSVAISFVRTSSALKWQITSTIQHVTCRRFVCLVWMWRTLEWCMSPSLFRCLSFTIRNLAYSL